MKKLLTLLLLFAVAKAGFSQIVISGYMANPQGTDAPYEYVQLIATENIDFSSTPYTVVWLNNSTVTTKAWVNGGSISYSFLLNSGTVSQGDIFYVGGSGKLIAGSGSTDISGLKWIKTINNGTTNGDIFGTAASGGNLGNGGANADAVGVFSGQLATTDSTKKPIDCVFFGTGVGTALSSGKGYPVADNDLYSSSQGLFGQGTNTFIADDPASNFFVRLVGTFNLTSKTWTSKRTSSKDSLTSSSTATNITTKITLVTSTPTITVNTAGFTNDFGLTYPNTPSSGSNFVFSGSNLTDSISVTIGAPFEIRVGVNAYASGTIKIPHSSGTVGMTVLDVRFNPTTTGSFEDTIYFTSNGAVTQKVMVKGSASNNPSVSFKGATVTTSESGVSVKVQVNIANANINPTLVDLILLSGGTASAGSDFTFTSPQTLTFPANSSDSVVITIPIIDDSNAETSETIMFALTNATNGALIGTSDTFIVTITDNDYRKVNIGPITTVTANGVVDSLNGRYEVTGVVYGTNVKTSAGGFQFTLRDQTGGVTIFSSSKTFGYTVAQGDSLTVRGTMFQFNGLAEISPTDTVIFHQSNKPLHAPRLVTTFGETEENDLVRFNGVTAKPGNWLSGNQYVYINGGADSIQVRIVPSTHQLIGKPTPGKAFSLVGIGGQFDASSPYTSGYQLFPRDSNDVIIIPDSLSAFNLLTPGDGATVTISGASTQTLDATWEPSQQATGLLPPAYTFLLDLPAGNFTTPLATFPSNVGGTATTVSIPYFQIVALMNTQGLTVGQSLSVKWTVKATTTNNYSKLANQPHTLTLVRGVMNGVHSVNQNAVTLYPNPASNNVFVAVADAIKTITIATIDGRLVSTDAYTGANTATLDIAGIETGIYLVTVETATGNYTQRLAVQR